MKKSVIILVGCVLLLASCKKEADTPVTNYPVNGATFTCCLETMKTTLCEGDRIAWESSDEIAVNGIVYSILSIDEENPSVAVFAKKNAQDPEPEKVDGKYYAYYPADFYDGLHDVAHLPAIRNYDPLNPNALSGLYPMFSVTTERSFSFRNVCGLFEFKLKGEGKVTAISIVDAVKGLSGTCTIDDGAAVLTADADAAAAGVSLDCGQGVALSASDATLFRVPVPTGDFANLSIMVFNDCGKMYSVRLASGKTAAIKRNTIYPVTLNVDFSEVAPVNGVFTIGEGRKVRFASGNLCYADGKWTTEDSQYGCAGDWDESHVCLFGRTDKGTRGYGADETYVATDAAVVDWGKIYCQANSLPEGSWTTLSAKEWNYLLEERTMTGGAPRYVNTVALPLTIEGVACSGLFIYPDSYSGETVDESFTWSRISVLGIAFLPASGCRNGAAVDGVGSYGHYWANDKLNGLLSYNVRFSSNGTMAYNAFGSHFGYAVRLVCPAE